MTIRCWDEFDASESYQFRSKSKHEFTALKMLWNMNSLATGHDDGTLVLWNSDAGTNVVSRGALRTSVTSIIEARSARSYFLAASDISGRIALWNLTQFRLNPVSLPLESVLQSRHDSEEPGALSLAFHCRFNAFFSGGVDLTIRAWRADQESCVTTKAHAESVCCLEISDSFLLSGDEGGEVFLWRITLDEFASGKSAPLPTLTALCRWFGARDEQPSRSVVALHEARDGGATVVQAGRGGTTWVWGVSFGHQEQAEGPGKGGEEEEKKDEGQEGREEEKWNADKEEEGEGEVVVRAVDLQKERGDDEEFRVSLSSTRVSALSTIEHQQDYEVTCAQLSCSEGPRCLYLGTSEGPVKRISV
jgi:WD40 repeat protein